MATLKLLSWNIEKLGQPKLNDAKFRDYVATVIAEQGSDFVGLMEVLSNVGQQLVDLLIPLLNAKTQTSWSGYSTRQEVRNPKEQYVLLWKTDQYADVKANLFGLVDEDAFKTFFTANGITDPEAFWKTLNDNRYVRGFVVNPNKRAELQEMRETSDYRVLGFSNLTEQQNQEIVELLLVNSGIGFPNPKSRPPVIVRATVKQDDSPLLLLLFHAPEPGSKSQAPAYASNLLAQINSIRSAGFPRVVLMGDFNTRERSLDTPFTLYESNTAAQPRAVRVVPNERTVATAIPFQRLVGPPVQPDPKQLDASQQLVLAFNATMPVVRTSLKKVVNAAKQGDEATYERLKAFRSEPYDNFLARGFGDRLHEIATVVPLIDKMIPKIVLVASQDPDQQPDVKQTSVTGTPFSLPLSDLGALVYQTWFVRQGKKKRRFPKKKDGTITELPDGIISMRDAQIVYRSAISDHMPIAITLTY